MQAWLDIDQLATVEVSSEDPGRPVEGALIPESGSFWRAAKPGPQKVRLKFDQPQRISQIALLFQEPNRERTQEFVLRWMAKDDPVLREGRRCCAPRTPHALAEPILERAV